MVHEGATVLGPGVVAGLGAGLVAVLTLRRYVQAHKLWPCHCVERDRMFFPEDLRAYSMEKTTHYSWAIS